MHPSHHSLRKLSRFVRRVPWLRGSLRVVPVVLAFVAPAVMPCVSHAQPSPRTRTSETFAKYIPASVSSLVSVRSLASLDKMLGDVRAGQIVAHLGGTGADARREADWRTLLEQFLGAESAVDLATLMQTEAAIAIDPAGSKPELVWFFRLRDRALLEKWFPAERRTAQDTSRGSLIFRTPDGLIVAQRDDVLFLARRWIGDRLLIDTVALLTDKDVAPLEKSRPYQELAAYLPAGALATVYMNKGAGGGALAALRRAAGLDLERLVLGVYGSPGNVELAVRGTLVKEVKPELLRPRAIGQMLRLPRTTLFAATRAVKIDPASFGGSGGSEVSKYVRLLLSLRRGGGADRQPLTGLGPHVVFAWGQSVAGTTEFPEIAVLLECEDAAAIKAELDASLENVAAAIRTFAPEQLSGLNVLHETYLGVSVSCVRKVTVDDPARLGALRLLTDVEPAWAAWGNWLVLATHREHLDRILDAQFGMVPTLGSLPEARVLRPGQEDVTLMAVVQASAAAEQINTWLSEAREDAPLWLDPLWWDAVLGADVLQSKSLGLRIERRYAPGQITVQSAAPDAAAAGLLVRGDQIIGLNGKLLDLTDPARDFRQQWRHRSRETSPTLRIVRDGEAMDVVLPVVVDVEGDRPEFDPAPMLRELASLVRGTSFAGLTVHATDERHYSARLTLRVQNQTAKPTP